MRVTLLFLLMTASFSWSNSHDDKLPLRIGLQFCKAMNEYRDGEGRELIYRDEAEVLLDDAGLEMTDARARRFNVAQLSGTVQELKAKVDKSYNRVIGGISGTTARSRETSSFTAACVKAFKEWKPPR